MKKLKKKQQKRKIDKGLMGSVDSNEVHCFAMNEIV